MQTASAYPTLTPDSTRGLTLSRRFYQPRTFRTRRSSVPLAAHGPLPPQELLPPLPVGLEEGLSSRPVLPLAPVYCWQARVCLQADQQETGTPQMRLFPSDFHEFLTES